MIPVNQQNAIRDLCRIIASSPTLSNGFTEWISIRYLTAEHSDLPLPTNSAYECRHGINENETDMTNNRILGELFDVDNLELQYYLMYVYYNKLGDRYNLQMLFESYESLKKYVLGNNDTNIIIHKDYISRSLTANIDMSVLCQKLVRIGDDYQVVVDYSNINSKIIVEYNNGPIKFKVRMNGISYEYDYGDVGDGCNGLVGILNPNILYRIIKCGMEEYMCSMLSTDNQDINSIISMCSIVSIHGVNYLFPDYTYRMKNNSADKYPMFTDIDISPMYPCNDEGEKPLTMDHIDDHHNNTMLLDRYICGDELDIQLVMAYSQDLGLIMYVESIRSTGLIETYECLLNRSNEHIRSMYDKYAGLLRCKRSFSDLSRMILKSHIQELLTSDDIEECKCAMLTLFGAKYYLDYYVSDKAEAVDTIYRGFGKLLDIIKLEVPNDVRDITSELKSIFAYNNSIPY